MKFAIIGCGEIAGRHAIQAAAIGKLIAVCDIVEGKASSLAQKYQARYYTRIDDLLQNEREVDIIAVCTPNGLHAGHTMSALKEGFHVICEKPMAIRVTDCEQMIAESNYQKKELFIVKQNRFNPPVAAVKQMLDKKELGRIFSVQLNCCWHRGNEYYRDSWHGTKDMDGGILYTQFSHFIDLLQWMIGDVKDALAYSGNFAHQSNTAFEDTTVACLRFESGVLGSLHFTTNSYQRNMEGSIAIIAERGTVKIGGQYLNKIDYQLVENRPMEELAPGNLPNDYGHSQGSMSNHDKIYRHVAEVITQNIPNQFNGWDGLKTVQIIEKIYSAAG